MRGSFWLVLILLACTSFAYADTTWVTEGIVSGNWTIDHSPYMIQGDINVPGTYSLTIWPGVRVCFAERYHLRIDSFAQFNVFGTISDSVIFTTALSNTLGWDGLQITAAADTVRLCYVILEKAFSQLRLDPAFSVRQSSLLCEHSTFRDNHGYADGGAMVIDNCDARFSDCCFFSNQSDEYGGVGWLHRGRYEFVNCVFDDNYSHGAGGALWLGSSTASMDTVRIDNCLFSHNQAGSFGGAIFVDRMPVLLRHTTLSNNRAHGGGGGAVCVYYRDLRAEDCRFHWNAGGALGGAILADQADLYRCVLDSNLAMAGGALYHWSAANPFRVNNCTLLHNGALDSGSALSGNTNNLTFHNNIVAYSIFSVALAGVGAVGDIAHNLFFGNVSSDFPAATAPLGVLSTLNANGDSCDAFHNLYLDPLLMDLAAGDYHLQSASPGIDAGDPATPRDPDSTLADIGAFYFPHNGRHVPEPFHLIGPDDMVITADNYSFVWQRTVDGDTINWPEPVDYFLQFQGPDSLITFGAGGDTALTVDFSNEYYSLPNHRWVSWWVAAHSMHPDTLTFSLDTFRIFLDYPDAVDEPLILHPSAFILNVYPNPFNATTVFTYDIPQTAPVTLKLFNLLGEEVATLADGSVQPGRYRTTWNAAAFSSGTYLAVLQTGDHRFIQKLLLLK